MISEALIRAAISASTDSIVITEAGDADERPIIFVNDAFLKLSGYTEEECLGRDCRFMNAGLPPQLAVSEVRETLEAGQPSSVRVQNKRKNGEVFWNELRISPVRLSESSAVTHFIGVQHDVTELVMAEQALAQSLKELQEQRHELDAQLHTDALTGLGNRRELDDELDSLFDSFALADASVPAEPIGILRIDIDNFRAYNGIAGQSAGDDVLKHLATTLLAQTTSANGLLVRYGADEFAVLVRNGSLESLKALAERLRQRVYELEIENLGSGLGRISVSIGGVYVTDPLQSTLKQIWRSVDAASFVARGARGTTLIAGESGNAVSVHAFTTPSPVTKPAV